MKSKWSLGPLRWTLLPLVLVVLSLCFGSVALAQEKTLYWQRYDVDITVQKNGDLRIVETQELVFTAGSFTYGQREILLQRLSNITDVTVSELGGRQYSQSSSDAPYTYRTFEEGGYLKVRYNFPPTANSRRTIVTAYTVSGALRYYPEKGVDSLTGRQFPAATRSRLGLRRSRCTCPMGRHSRTTASMAPRLRAPSSPDNKMPPSP